MRRLEHAARYLWKQAFLHKDDADLTQYYLDGWILAARIRLENRRKDYARPI